MQRIHLQFSGSIQPEDAEQIIPLLKAAIERRPPNCGAVLRVRELPADADDDSKNDRNGIVLPINELLSALSSGDKDNV
jgi:hypothetical protein